MKSHDRLLSALKFDKTDRVPWTALVTEYYLNSLPESLKLYNSFDLLKRVGADPVELSNWQMDDWGKRIVGTDFRVIVERQGLFTRTSIETPLGTVSQTDKRESAAGTTFRTEHFIKTAKDCEIMQCIYENLVDSPDVGGLKRHSDGLGDEGLLLYFAIRSPLQMLLEELCGVEHTLMLLFDEPQFVESLLRSIHKKNMEMYRIAVEKTPIEVAISIEDTSTTIISPAIFEKHIVPYINDYAKIVHEKNIIFGAHMCGWIKDLLPLIKQTDLDGIESVTPPPLGNTELRYAREILGDEFFLIGGLSAPFVKDSSPDEVKKAVKRLLTEFRGEQGFVIEVTDDVSAGTPIENLRAISEAIDIEME
jgi:hypothetical protein